MHLALPGLVSSGLSVLGLEDLDAAVSAHNRCLAAVGMRRVSANRCGAVQVLHVQNNGLKCVCMDAFSYKSSRLAEGCGWPRAGFVARES